MRENREIPLALVDPAQIPGKWRRLDLTLPTLEFAIDADDPTLTSTISDFNLELSKAIAGQLETWAIGDGATEGWRDVTVLPGDTLSEQAWMSAMAQLANRPIDRSRIIPDMSRVSVTVDRQADFLNPGNLSLRVILDNQSLELAPQDSQGRCNRIFGAGISIAMEKAGHVPLRLDRVEPSYRFRDHLDYPAIGLNCGVVAEIVDHQLRLQTTPAPRFSQPRI